VRQHRPQGRRAAGLLTPSHDGATESHVSANRRYDRAIDATKAAVIVIVAGLVVIAALGALAMFKTEGDMAPIATAAFGVIGSVVGAFFGVHAGASVTRREAQKTQKLLATMMDDGAKKDAVNEVLDASVPRSERG
jgi:ABC-type transport system involved in cytochrome bd biosynthesis fused ATPase/permease subunit